jgi:hypothetical protein
MGLVIAVLRVLVVLLVVRFLSRAVAAFARTAWPGSFAPPVATPRFGPDLVRDRVCNTFLPRDRALSAIVGGREQHFCSPECRAKAEP